MLNVTYEATEHLAYMLAQANAPEGKAIRLVRHADGVKMNLDSSYLADETFEHDGKTVLLIDEKVLKLLSGKTLDVEHTEKGPALTLE